MTSAIFVDAICTAPWGFSVPPMASVTQLLAPGTEHLVGYHLVTEGDAVIGLDGASDLANTAGDIVIFPHGDPLTVANGTPAHFADSGKALGQWLAGDAVRVRLFRLRAPCRSPVPRRLAALRQDERVWRRRRRMA